MSALDRRSFLGSTAALAGASAAGAASLAAMLHSAAAADDQLANDKSAGAVVPARDPATQDPATLGKTPHTKFAINVEMWFTKLKVFEDRLRASAALGFPAVELWPWQNKDIDSVAKVSEELGIAIAQFTAWGFTPGLNETKNHDAFLKAIEDGCKVAKKWRCGLMTVVAGNDVPGMTQEQMHDNVIAGLKRAVPIVAEHKITLILEPMNIRVDHKGHCLYGSAPAIRICKAVGSEFVKINWDLYHMQISEGDLCGHLREGFPYVGYLQLADHPGRNEPGTGEIHYNRVLKEAYELGYRGYVGLECRPKTTELAAAQAVARADVW